MGWSFGGDVFDLVGELLVLVVKSDGLSSETAKAIASKLISGLQDRGWDTEDESLETFIDHPWMVEAFAENLIVPNNYDEYDGLSIHEEPGPPNELY